MTLEQLKVFVAVAERQHITRAAASLNLSQSAVSASISALEARHGTKLFDRVGRGVSLTTAGEQFLPEARTVLARAASAEQMLLELAGLKRGTLAVQASQTIASYWLPRHLVAFRRAYPGIEIRLTIGNTAQVAHAVNLGEAELGFVEGAVADDSLISTQVARDQLMVVVAPGHPWAGRRRLSAADLAAGEWVLREAGSGTRSEFEQAMQNFGMPVEHLHIVLELPSNEAVRAAVEAGLGATAVSASVAAPSLEAGLLQPANMPLPERAFHVVHHCERSLSSVCLAFMAMLHYP
jgi:DNA-binding transcriptional LysR family regulator